MQKEITVKITTETYAKPLTADAIANSLRYGTFNPHKFTVEEVKPLDPEEEFVLEGTETGRFVTATAESNVVAGIPPLSDIELFSERVSGPPELTFPDKPVVPTKAAEFDGSTE